jgi:hypothetical protein
MANCRVCVGSGRVADSVSRQRAEAGGYRAMGEHCKERKQGRDERQGMPPTRSAAVGMEWVQCCFRAMVDSCAAASLHEGRLLR